MARTDKYDATTVKGRLMLFLREKRLSQSEFGRILGVAPTYIGAMRKSLSADKVNKLIRAFPDLNRDWLLYGEGCMLRDSEAESPGKAEETSAYEVPLLPVSAYAGNLQLWSEPVQMRDCERIMSPVRDADFAIRLSGDSMEPLLHDGAVLFIKRINERAFIPWGNPMVIDTENGVLIKELFPSDQGHGYVQARSLNPKYPPLEIPVESVFGLYRVISSTRIFTTM